MLLIVLGCAREIVVTPSQTPCIDVDYLDPAPSTVEWSPEGDGALVQRSYVFLDQAGLRFSPTAEVDQGVLMVHEAWTDPTSDDPFCYIAQVLLTDYAGSLEVRWFTEDAPESPFATVVVD